MRIARLVSLFALGALACTPVEPPGPCVPECGARICGKDPICGKICGPACPDDGVCAADGLSCRAALPVGAACTSDDACGAGRVCLGRAAQAVGGYCSRRCGEGLPCPAGSVCGDAAGERFCLAACGGANSCRILEGYACSAEGVCPACVPTCEGRACGDDGCGGSCGTCWDVGQVCAAGACASGFRDVTVLPEVARWDAAASLDDRGVAWVFGGRKVVTYPNGDSVSEGLNRVDTYDPEGKAWTSAKVLPAKIAGPHVALVGNAFWLAGGADDPGAVGAPDGLVDGLYTLERGLWEPKGALPVASRGGALLELGGKLYLFVGETAEGPSNRVDIYDPAQSAGTWASGEARPTARSFFAAVSDGNRAYLLGGWSGTAAVGTVEIFDPATGWTSAPALPVGVVSARAVLAENRIFVFGGMEGPTLESTPRPFVQAYDLTTRRSSQLGLTYQNFVMQTPLRLRSGKVLLFGGTLPDRGAPSPQNEVVEFVVPAR
jgi:hypothetical protein